MRSIKIVGLYLNIFLFAAVFILFHGCSHNEVVPDALAGAAESGDLSAHISGGSYVGSGLVKFTPNVGTSTENLFVNIEVPPKKVLECGSVSCAKIEIRDGAQALVVKWAQDEKTLIQTSFFELLKEFTFQKEHSFLFGVKVTVYYKQTEIVYFGEIRLKPVAEGYQFLAPRDRFAAFVWPCFDKKHECGLSTKGRSYVVLK